MDRFRVISDLHLDINQKYPLELKDKDVFTVVCGDIAGETEAGIDWIKKNVRRGIVVNGNHMPYRNASAGYGDQKTMDEFREWLKNEFPAGSDISYLDVQAGDFMKEIDGILFLGSCFYTNFRISEPTWNPGGDRKLNMMCSRYSMNDYRYGITEKTFKVGADAEPSYKRLDPEDLCRWFNETFTAFDAALAANEKKENPLPVVIVTHYPLTKDLLEHSFYVESPNCIRSVKEFTWGSYASDMEYWLLSHPSVRCVCSGHIHDVEKEWRTWVKKRRDGPDILFVHNPRGYVSQGHARWFNPDTFVDTKTWKAFETPLTDEEEEARKKPSDEYFSKYMAWGIF